MEHLIELNGRNVVFDLQYKEVKNINVRIKPNLTVMVSANSTVPFDTIVVFLNEKSEYILTALDHYAELKKYAPKAKQYVDGESFWILGHERRLKVLSGCKNSVKSDESYIYLTVKNMDDVVSKQRIVNAWLNKFCKETILACCREVYPIFEKYGVEFPEIRFRNMISRWGSCQPKRGVLTFNYSLIEVPMACIEYVVVHEFTHFLQPNHSSKFYSQLSTIMPDWKNRKELLEKNHYLTV